VSSWFEDHLQLAESVAQALKSTGLTVDVLHDGVAADLALGSEEYAARSSMWACRAWTVSRCWRACGRVGKSAGADADGAQ